MTTELREERKDFIKAQKSFLRDKTMDRRQFYMNKKKKFKRNMYLIKRAFQERKKTQIGILVKKAPNDFWKAVKKLIQNTKEKKNDSISPRVWSNYFKKLLNSHQKTNYEQWPMRNNPELDKPFTITEIKEALKSCKNNKSSSTGVTFEMLKCNLNKFFPFLCMVRPYGAPQSIIGSTSQAKIK